MYLAGKKLTRKKGAVAIYLIVRPSASTGKDPLSGEASGYPGSLRECVWHWKTNGGAGKLVDSQTINWKGDAPPDKGAQSVQH